MTRPAPQDDPSLGFEDALGQLDRTVAQLEGGELDLDGALAQYERGVHLLTRCRSMLDAAERQVAILTGVDDAGQPLTAPFDASATIESKPSPAAPPAPSSPTTMTTPRSRYRMDIFAIMELRPPARSPGRRG